MNNTCTTVKYYTCQHFSNLQTLFPIYLPFQSHSYTCLSFMCLESKFLPTFFKLFPYSYATIPGLRDRKASVKKWLIIDEQTTKLEMYQSIIVAQAYREPHQHSFAAITSFLTNGCNISYSTWISDVDPSSSQPQNLYPENQHIVQPLEFQLTLSHTCLSHSAVQDHLSIFIPSLLP